MLLSKPSVHIRQLSALGPRILNELLSGEHIAGGHPGAEAATGT